VGECNTVPTKNKIQKGQFLLPFFFVCTKTKSDEKVMKDFLKGCFCGLFFI